MLFSSQFQCESEPKIYNTHIIINPDGEIVGKYSKLHLFNVDIPGKVRLSESDIAIAGRKISAPVPTPAGNIGLGVVSLPLLVAHLSSILLLLAKSTQNLSRCHHVRSFTRVYNCCFMQYNTSYKIFHPLHNIIVFY